MSLTGQCCNTGHGNCSELRSRCIQLSTDKSKKKSLKGGKYLTQGGWFLTITTTIDRPQLFWSQTHLMPMKGAVIWMEHQNLSISKQKHCEMLWVKTDRLSSIDIHLTKRNQNKRLSSTITFYPARFLPCFSFYVI